MAMLGVIGGTGLDRWGGLANEIKGETPYGSASAPVAVYTAGATQILFVSRHGLGHTIPPHRVNYRANLFALHQAGVREVIAINAVGGIGSDCGPGVVVLPDQLIDYTWGREQSFSDDAETNLQHVEFAEPFSGALRQRLIDTARAHQIQLTESGCVGVVQGPRLETSAEIRRLARDGCDLVGMTTMPEAALARELGMDYACVAMVANWAAGMSEEPITMAAIERVLAATTRQVRGLIAALCEAT